MDLCAGARGDGAGNRQMVALTAGLFLLAIGEALGTPVLIAATRKYSNTRQRSVSFSMIYAIMNLGFLASGYLFDWVRQGLGEYGHWNLPFLGWQLTTYRTLFLVSWAIELLVLPVVWFLREGAEVTDEGVRIVPSHGPATGQARTLNHAWQTVRESYLGTVDFFTRLVKQPGFYRLLSFLFLVSFLKLVFMQMDYVFPTWGVRELGEGAPVGHLQAINNYFIIFLVPVIGTLTQRFSAYRMVILGGTITAASVFVMILPPQWFESLASGWVGHWIGHYYLGLHGAVHPYYVMVAFFVIAMSFGEAFYSPRVYEYAAAIAPKGRRRRMVRCPIFRFSSQARGGDGFRDAAGEVLPRERRAPLGDPVAVSRPDGLDRPGRSDRAATLYSRTGSGARRIPAPVESRPGQFAGLPGAAGVGVAGAGVAEGADAAGEGAGVAGAVGGAAAAGAGVPGAGAGLVSPVDFSQERAWRRRASSTRQAFQHSELFPPRAQQALPGSWHRRVRASRPVSASRWVRADAARWCPFPRSASRRATRAAA